MNKALFVLPFLAALALSVFAGECPPTSTTTEFAFDNSGDSAWLVNGCVVNPTLPLKAGTLYTFYVSKPTEYPLFIANSEGEAITVGVTNAGSSTVTYTPSESDIGKTNVYYDPNHPSMKGSLRIVGSSTLNEVNEAEPVQPTQVPPPLTVPTNINPCPNGLVYQNNHDFIVGNIYRYQTNSWFFETCLNPPIRVWPGRTYRFIVVNWTEHPLYIRHVLTNVESSVSDAGTSIVTFKPTQSEVGKTYEYYEPNMYSMAGIIKIGSPPAAPRPQGALSGSSFVTFSAISLIFVAFFLF